MTTPRALTESDLESTTALLVRCFRDDPGYTSVFGAQTESGLDFLVRRLLAMRLEAGATLIGIESDGEVIAMMSWAESDVTFGLSTYLRHGLVWMPLRFGFGAVRRMLAADDEAGALRKAHAPDGPYIWGTQFAVDPAHRSARVGLIMTRTFLSTVDARGLPAATMTTHPRVLAAYRRFGFEQRGHLRSAAGHDLWMLVREART